VREDQAVATDYQDALFQVAQAVPARSWNNFVRSPPYHPWAVCCPLTHLPL
jgi:hypothetical protein